MDTFFYQVRKHCHDCGVPLRGYGQLACGGESQAEQTSAAHAAVFRPKRAGRGVQIVTTVEQLRAGALARTTDYMGNARR
jgi:hypothetical protein